MWNSTAYPLEDNIISNNILTAKVLNKYDTCQCNPKNGGKGTCLCGFFDYDAILKEVKNNIQCLRKQ